MKKGKLKINKAMKGHKAGSIIDIDLYENGSPKEKFWRRRLNDSIKDNCVELLEEQKAKKQLSYGKKKSGDKQ